jgi:methyl-accepting chemotaxis protein
MTSSPSPSDAGAQTGAVARGPRAAGADAEIAVYRAYVARAAEVCRRAARGDLEARILEIDAPDELAELMHGINHLLDMTDAFVREAGATLDHAAAGKFFRRVLPNGLLGSFRRGADGINRATEEMADARRELHLAVEGRLRLADDFEIAVKATVDTLASAVTELQATAEVLARTADETGVQAGEANVAVARASASVHAIAAAAERLASSAAEVGTQVEAASRSAQGAVHEADATNATVNGLSQASHRIGKVVGLIAQVAGQTNLLALNATIEAARAGEAGKGFAVVASEVKQLATQTKGATEEIGDQVQGIQTATGQVVSAIQGITTSIAGINDASMVVSASVKEQQVAAAGIRESSDAAARAAAQVANNVDAVAASAKLTGDSSTQLLAAANELARLAETLRADVDAFLHGVRSA